MCQKNDYLKLIGKKRIYFVSAYKITKEFFYFIIFLKKGHHLPVLILPEFCGKHPPRSTHTNAAEMCLFHPHSHQTRELTFYKDD